MSDDFETDVWDREYPTEQELLEQQIEGQQDQDEDFEYEDDDIEDFIGEYLPNDGDDEDSHVSVMDNARVRLEQGRLYEMLIKHDLFDGVDALPQAIDNVQKELKEFIMERLEILLGMKAEKETEIQQIINDPQFNDVEVQALKMIASKVTKGASATAPTTKPQPSELNTVRKENQNKGLNSLGGKKTSPPTPKKTTNKPAPSKPSKPLPKRGSEKPQRKPKPKMTEEQKKAPVTGKVSDIAERDMKYLDSLKDKSLEEANAIVSQRHNRPKPKKPIDQKVVNSHYQTQVSMQDGKVSDLGRIMRMAALNKAKQNQ